MPTVVPVVSAPQARPAVWRISDRTTFERLRRDGRRARGGPLSVVALPADGPDHPPRVAFAVSKGAGSAVVRNRIRRRLRAACRELAREGALPSGSYLVGATSAAATLAWDQLVAGLRALLDEVAP
jgi:ribonuclease P protein component